MNNFKHIDLGALPEETRNRLAAQMPKEQVSYRVAREDEVAAVDEVSNIKALTGLAFVPPPAPPPSPDQLLQDTGTTQASAPTLAQSWAPVPVRRPRVPDDEDEDTAPAVETYLLTMRLTTEYDPTELVLKKLGRFCDDGSLQVLTVTSNLCDRRCCRLT